MKRRHGFIGVLLVLVGVGIGYAAAKNVQPAVYRSKSKTDAGKALLEQAKIQAGKGSWERIAVGRVYYLAGMKPQGQAIFDEVLGKKPESSDLFRVARIYREAGEWQKAKEIFDRYLKENAKDDKALAEVGAYYLLNGDRATAEDLFERSFKLESEMWSTVAAAGAYLGVKPQE